jgi:hypothetical protein
MATKKQIRDFALVKNGYMKIKTKEPTNKNGKLLIDNIIHMYDKPFPLLQYEKSKLIKSGVSARRITISYI